ncbi:MAG: exosortase/archaeosortase family protein [Fuerstiella sp.]
MTENTIQPADDQKPSAVSLVLKFCPFILLAVAHLPLVLTEYSALWDKEHYQFFPLALVSFGCYFYARRLPGRFHWRPICWVLLAIDISLLIYGCGLSQFLFGVGLLTSPLAALVGFWLLIWAICLACSDLEVKSSLAYLIVLPLITVRPPLGYDQNLILWLQRITTSVASEILNFFGYLHMRSGVILEFPGKNFQVADACSGVQSLYAVLFLAAFVTCGYRRKLFHSVIVIASGLLFAGVMNVLRISVIAIAWETSALDLTSGLTHDVIGYVALFAAAMLVFSADAFLAFCFYPVPDVKGAGITSIYRNPFVTAWNWLFRRTLQTEVVGNEVVSLPPRVLAVSSIFAVILCVSCLILQTRNLGLL